MVAMAGAAAAVISAATATAVAVAALFAPVERVSEVTHNVGGMFSFAFTE